MNTEKSPLISVIVPVYKVEKYLPACLDSLLAQTYRNFELIVVNDGSPDDCWQIMQRYAAQDARVRIFNKENGGVSSARNFGLDVARGEYIGFVDSDDFVLPQYLEWLYDALCSCGTRMAMCRYRSIRENESRWTVTECPAPQRITAENYSWMREWSGGHCWRMLTHRELLGTWAENAARFQAGMTVPGIVRGLKEYGAFVELTPNLSGLAERKNGLREGDRVSVYIKAILPERMKIKLLAIDTLPPLNVPAPLEYFLTQGQIEKWKYAPEGCVKVGAETIFA